MNRYAQSYDMRGIRKLIFKRMTHSVDLALECVARDRTPRPSLRSHGTEPDPMRWKQCRPTLWREVACMQSEVSGFGQGLPL